MWEKINNKQRWFRELVCMLYCSSDLERRTVVFCLSCEWSDSLQLQKLADTQSVNGLRLDCFFSSPPRNLPVSTYNTKWQNYYNRDYPLPLLPFSPKVPPSHNFFCLIILLALANRTSVNYETRWMIDSKVWSSE